MMYLLPLATEGLLRRYMRTLTTRESDKSHTIKIKTHHQLHTSPSLALHPYDASRNGFFNTETRISERIESNHGTRFRE